MPKWKGRLKSKWWRECRVYCGVLWYHISSVIINPFVLVKRNVCDWASMEPANLTDLTTIKRN